MPCEKSELENYKDATWDFVLEHCDILDSGKMFVKFHIDNRKNFENRVWARYKYNYHREDVKAKALIQQVLRTNFEASREQKRKEYEEERARRREVYAQNSRMADWRRWYEKTQRWGILGRIWGYIGSNTWNKKPSN